MMQKVRDSLLIVLVSALAIRLAWEIVRPVLPLLVVLGVLAFVMGLLLPRHR